MSQDQNNGQQESAPQSFVRFIGRIKARVCNGANGQFQKFTAWMDNPKANNDDGTPNQYYKGCLIWIDAETGQKFLVKQIELAGVNDAQKQKGFVNSLKINLEDGYHVENLG